MESLSNNPLSSARYDAGKAKEMAGDLAQVGDVKGLEALISAKRLSKASAGSLLETARRLVMEQARKGGTRDISEDARLELALGFLAAKDYAMAIHFLNEISASKSARIKAAVLNTFGVLDLILDRTPEAVEYWKKSLAVDPSYRPAAYNLGFIAMKYGDIKTGRARLIANNDDWFAEAGIFVADRNAGSTSLDGRCTRLLEKQADHPMIVFNCGLYQYQNKGNFKEAKELLEKSKGLKGGEPSWDSSAGRLIAEMNRAEGEKKSREAEAKRMEAAKKAPAGGQADKKEAGKPAQQPAGAQPEQSKKAH